LEVGAERAPGRGVRAGHGRGRPRAAGAPRLRAPRRDPKGGGASPGTDRLPPGRAKRGDPLPRGGSSGAVPGLSQPAVRPALHPGPARQPPRGRRRRDLVMPAVTVRHATGQYQVHIEPGILLSLPELLGGALGRRKLVLITDDIVARYYDEWTHATPNARALGARSSDAGIRLRCEARLTFPAGEEHKTRETWVQLSDRMLSQGLDRQTAIVALGGGVVGDLAGFVAATYLRGVPYAQVPTTLLAMLDASVGGKVGVDTSLGKNLIGAFHPPAVVVADPLTLLTLPD